MCKEKKVKSVQKLGTDDLILRSVYIPGQKFVLNVLNPVQVIRTSGDEKGRCEQSKKGMQIIFFNAHPEQIPMTVTMAIMKYQ